VVPFTKASEWKQERGKVSVEISDRWNHYPRGGGRGFGRGQVWKSLRKTHKRGGRLGTRRGSRKFFAVGMTPSVGKTDRTKPWKPRPPNWKGRIQA